MFKTNEFIFYPGYGVGIVKETTVQKVGSVEIAFYNIVVIENNMKIMVPVKNSDEVGLRQLISAEDIQKVFDVLECKEDKHSFCKKESWNKRYNGYNLKLCSA